MKNLFGVNITHSKKNDIIDGADFITKRLSPELQNKFDFCFNGGKSQKETLPLPLMIIQIISMIFLGLTFVTNIKSIFERKLFVAFHKMPYLYLVEIINILIFILLKVLEILKKKQVIMCEEDAETNNLSSSSRASMMPCDWSRPFQRVQKSLECLSGFSLASRTPAFVSRPC